MAPRLIKIHEIECLTQFGKCEETLQAKFSRDLGQSLYASQKNFHNAIKSEIVITDSRSQFIFPNKLKIYLVLKTPKFAIEVNQNAYALVGEEGFVISILPATDFPFLRGNFPNYSVNQKVEDGTLFALKILENLNYLYKLKLGQLTDSSLHIELEDGTRVIFPLEGNIKALVGSLRLLLDQKDELYQKLVYREIDLRYKNPIIR